MVIMWHWFVKCKIALNILKISHPPRYAKNCGAATINYRSKYGRNTFIYTNDYRSLSLKQPKKSLTVSVCLLLSLSLSLLQTHTHMHMKEKERKRESVCVFAIWLVVYLTNVRKSCSSKGNFLNHAT